MKEQLDQVQEGLTRLCQDATLELELRLQLLELIELRTLGWETSESMEKFYTDKFKEVRDKRDGEDLPRRPMTEDKEEAAQEMIQVGPVQLFLSSSSREVTVAAKEQLEQFFTPASSPSAPTTSHVTTQDTTTLNQSNTRYTVPPIPSPTHHYTREMLLTLANNQESLKAPLNWARRIQSLPRVIVKQQR